MANMVRWKGIIPPPHRVRKWTYPVSPVAPSSPANLDFVTYSGGIQTTDATTTTSLAFEPPVASAGMVEATIFARKSDGTEVAGYLLSGLYRRTYGSCEMVGDPLIFTQEEDNSWVVTMDADAHLIRIRVTGEVGTTIEWYTIMRTSSGKWS
jgi:hypothetical protein